MLGCPIHIGFFVLRVCGAVEQTTCPTCRRSICAKHLIADNLQGSICIECLGRTALDSETLLPSDPTWSYQFRTQYQKNAGENFVSPVFQEHELQALAQQADSALPDDADDTGLPDFGDS